MLQEIKNKINNPVFKAAVKEIAINVVTTIVVATAVKAVTYIAVEGTKSLIEEIKNRNTNNTAE